MSQLGNRIAPGGEARHEVRLSGCHPQPLAGWLKAVGVLRLVAEQADEGAQGWWERDEFFVRSRLDGDALVRFFLDTWRPSPVITPWNGGSGFFPKDNSSALDAIASSDDPRFADYREAIEVARTVLATLGIDDKPDSAAKSRLLLALRSQLPERALAWFDAAVAMAGDEPRFPPLLGTGGNDGRLEFANNQMQRLVELLIKGDDSELLLRAALFGDTVGGLRDTKVGQFAPGAAGGANAGPGFEANARVNPWDYVLMVEGTLMLTAACTRRLEAAEPGTLSYPFMVCASGIGYASASSTDEANSRHEIWLPLWRAPTGLAELRASFSEGRAKVGRRTAATGVDFARAVASLGVDRGFDAFERYAFHLRNGRSYFAVPTGRWPVRAQPAVDLLSDVDGWLMQLRRVAKSGPASLGRAARAVDDAILALCREGTPLRVQAVLAALGEAEAVVARSPKLRDQVRPLPRLSRRWIAAADDGSADFRLALALSGDRRRMVPVDGRRWLQQPDASTTWSGRGLIADLLATVARADVEAAREEQVARIKRPTAALGDLAAFVEGRVQLARIAALARGLSTIPAVDPRPCGPERPLPPALFSLLALAWHRPEVDGEPLPRTPGLVARAAAGDGLGATTLACRRLEGAGLPLLVRPLSAPAPLVRRAAAALAFPLSSAELSTLRQLLAPPKED